MIVLPNSFFNKLPSLSIVNVAENARRSTSGCRLHSSSDSWGGNIGTALWTRYTLVALFLASRSRAVLAFTTQCCQLTSADDTIIRQLTKVGHVGNVDANSICPIFVGLDRQRVVQILRRWRVDSEDPLASEILSDLVLSFRNAIGIRQLTRRLS